MTMMKSSIPAIAAAAALLLGGCQAGKVTDVAPEAKESIAYAATAKYPGTAQRSDRIQAVALDDPTAREVTVYNLKAEAIPATALWVNGVYVRQTGTIPARGKVTARYGAFLEASNPATDFAKARQAVQRVELQTADGLYTVLGPGLR
jgi:hypothetical protein